MAHVHQASQAGGVDEHLLAVRHLDIDLRDLDLLGVGGAALPSNDDVAELGFGGRERDVNVEVEVASDEQGTRAA